MPAWIKNSAGWGADDTISDGEFVNALQFLLKEGIIKIEQDESIPTDSGTEIIYQTKIFSKEPHTVAVVYTTQNETCSTDEKKKTEFHILPLRILEGARMPAIYISMGVISSPEEEARLLEINQENSHIVAIVKEVLFFFDIRL